MRQTKKVLGSCYMQQSELTCFKILQFLLLLFRSLNHFSLFQFFPVFHDEYSSRSTSQWFLNFWMDAQKWIVTHRILRADLPFFSEADIRTERYCFHSYYFHWIKETNRNFTIRYYKIEDKRNFKTILCSIFATFSVKLFKISLSFKLLPTSTQCIFWNCIVIFKCVTLCQMQTDSTVKCPF